MYIQVILPLKLAWNPWYYVPEEMEGSDTLQVGTRVRVRCAARIYVGVVSSTGLAPTIEEKKIQPVLSVEQRLEPILPTEIDLWKFIADYYLCTIGEVYKAAYPAQRVASESKKPHKTADTFCDVKRVKLTDSDKRCLVGIIESFDDGKPVLLQGSYRTSIYNELTRRTLEEGRDVLIISPGAPRMNPTERREISKALRSSSTPAVVRSSRTSIFLPYTKLGLVIVDEEQDQTLKQEAPAPRYNARDVAAVIARQQNARLLLGSSAPSMESLYNVLTQKYTHIIISEPKREITIIDTTAELHKNGMVGELSKKLIKEKEALEYSGNKTFVINSWELGNISKLKLDKYALVAILHFESLLSRTDFRADEKALQVLSKLKSSVKGELIIQTKDSKHPVFTSDVSRLLAERKSFNLPPFTRQIIIKSPAGEILDQAFFPKDKHLQEAKRSFVSDCPHNSIIDVDPY